MKMLMVLIVLILIVACNARFVEKRFNKKDIFPCLSEEKREKKEDSFSMHFGPGPNFNE